MGKFSEVEKQKQLGMPYGTATNRLRKIILFDFIKRCNEDWCFKCGVRILNLEDLSIEHKIPWLHNSSELFWDLSNIAFSHIWCNVPDRPYTGSKERTSLRKQGPKGTFWCSRHRQFLPEERFSKDRSRWSGSKSWCKECHKESRK